MEQIRTNPYITINPVEPYLLARSTNRILERAQHTTSDSDIPRRRWLGIDIDPDRVSGISSTDAEMSEAAQVLEELRGALSVRGWADPIVVMSGNGYWALYRIDLPNDPNSTNLLRGVLDTLGNEFDSTSAHVDRTVYNAGRIMPLPGTLKVKGDATVDRPHGRVKLISVPDEIVAVTETQLQEIVVTKAVEAQHPSATRGGVGRTVRGLADILMEHGIEFQEQNPDTDLTPSNVSS